MPRNQLETDEGRGAQGGSMDVEGTLLIYAPVPLYRTDDGVLLLEDQACNGLRLWADNFQRLIVMMPMEDGPAPPNWVPLSSVGNALERIEVHPLPTAYRPDRFLMQLPKTRRRIRRLIDRAEYLSFSIGGLFGDWGTVACFEASRIGRRYAVWTDRVESEVVRQGAKSGPWRARLRKHLTHRPMAWLERKVISRSELGLFHGRETYNTYSQYSRLPQLVHDIHISKKDHITDAMLAQKIERSGSGPLRICYVGRAEPMKGALDWITVMEKLSATAIDFKAVWLGDGSERAEMKRRIAEARLEGSVELPGHVADRRRLLSVVRDSQLFLFCHKTPESPRCLIEALISGTPIVGYEGAFAADLISVHGGGLLAPANDTAALAALVAGLAMDRTLLADLITWAARDGSPFEDAAVFKHRSSLIKKYL